MRPRQIYTLNVDMTKSGISKKQLEEFITQTEIYLEWKTKGERLLGEDTTNIMPWGKDTPQAYELISE